MPIFGERPVTSITIKINQLSTPHYNDDIEDSIELYLSDLLHLIKVQPTSGATEAARAIRKKIKYGDSVAQQLRALNILELLVLNSGPKIGPVLARDDKLIDVLKGILTGSGKTAEGISYHREVQTKVQGLAIGWKAELRDLEGYKYFAGLWQFIPRAKKDRGHSRSVSQASNTNAFDDDEYVPIPRASSPRITSPRVPPPRPTTASPYATTNTRKDRKDKKKKSKSKRTRTRYADSEYQIPQINYKIEAPKIRDILALAHTHTTALNNQLITLGPDVSPLDDAKISAEFDKCKSIRRKVLKYLQYVGAGDQDNKTDAVLAMDDEFLGSLIGANELLVETFKRYDAKCGYTAEQPAPNYDDEEDSDLSYYTESDDDDDEEYSDDNHADNDDDIRRTAERLQNATLGGSSSRAKSPPPPRPTKPAALSSVLAPPPITKNHTNSSVLSDPFGDSSAVSKSVYD